ncbi:hypothetical protein EV401DRAFT_1856586 [Pisolithus croceorrhizus]|nr:hypothetical protein EV401DRAFT_1856586 [Pisolithus croceorrhizus]
MVVTRRTPVVPSPPVSRSQSSQGVPRPVRASLAQDVTNFPKSSSPLASGESHVATAVAGEEANGSDKHSGKNKPKKHRKASLCPHYLPILSLTNKQNKRRKSNFQAFLDFLTKLLLLAFTIYAFSVCPHDTHQQTPLCRGLSEYKRIILDPYIIPPIQAAFSHPSIAPHVNRARPYIHHAMQATVPVISHAQSGWNTHVIPRWEKYVVPEWNKRIVPHWHKHVVPRVELVEQSFAPYQRRIEQVYKQNFAPSAQPVFYNFQRWQRQARPYILLAVSKTQEGYHAAKPYTAPLLKRAGYVLQQFALFLQDQRQKLVDPHVSKMWEKVKELSRGKQIVERSEPTAEFLSTELMPSIGDGLPVEQVTSHQRVPSITQLPDETLSPTLTPSVTPIAQAALDERELSSRDPSVTSEYVTLAAYGDGAVQTAAEPAYSIAGSVEVSTPLPEVETLLRGESVLLESLHTSVPYPSVVASVKEELNSSAFFATSTKSNSPTVPTPTRPMEDASRATLSGDHDDDDIDMDAFYAELGLDEPPTNPQQHTFVPPHPARHAKWEVELEAQKERSTAELQDRLLALREATAAELSSSAEVQNALETLASEAEKYIKGAEIYLKNLKGENRKRDEKLALWDRVVQKVGSKFTERLYAAEAVVNGPYNVLLQLELQEVSGAAAAVRDVAEKGQVDLGLDYAWLDDVTYNDWQRYHSLMGVSDNYAEEAASVQNGTHPSIVVANPLAPITEDLRSEVGDIVIGFETRLRRLKREGERAFNGNGAVQKEEEKGSLSEPEVSILPIPGTDTKERMQTFIPPVIIGRGKEEVLDALKKASVLDQPELSSDPEEVVSSLAREAEVEEVQSASSNVPHTEL